MALVQIQPSFWAEGACVDLPAEWFHPDRGESTQNAKAVCAACVVRVDCLTWALSNREKFGIWGGTSERERRRIRRRLAAGEPVADLVAVGDEHDQDDEEEEVDLNIVTAEAEPVSANGNRKPVDPDTGQPTDVCVNCGKRYTPDRRTQRFHSKECARAWYASHPIGESGKREPRTRKQRVARTSPTLVPARLCETCGESYRPTRKDQRFCTPTCRARHHNKTFYRPASERLKNPPEAVPVPSPDGTVEGPTLPPSVPPPGVQVDLQSLLGHLRHRRPDLASPRRHRGLHRPGPDPEEGVVSDPGRPR